MAVYTVKFTPSTGPHHRVCPPGGPRHGTAQLHHPRERLDVQPPQLSEYERGRKNAVEHDLRKQCRPGCKAGMVRRHYLEQHRVCRVRCASSIVFTTPFRQEISSTAVASRKSRTLPCRRSSTAKPRWEAMYTICDSRTAPCLAITTFYPSRSSTTAGTSSSPAHRCSRTFTTSR